ncbi:thioesterase II family protein [Actinoalloteichus sp. GBA129-24]|uniref:thioesterase II family protein n=1 Tax=Actinoalloteichus sp. GBA129-24 TaxID=1612551 RepID=UPI0009508D83|nr:alpha/beta fold hydrolase [Actinoalloteichus sp. GBA129-24]APU21339.1 non-ribosomal peptide synthesis thioesterase [Actinoalloteichus sp. GBA129-24]
MEDRWVRRYRDDDGCETKLICFAPAGAGASTFRTWARGLPEDVGVLAVAYPGRENRIGEPIPPRLEVLADDIADALGDLVGHRLVLFGHSMGATLAHEVALRFQERGSPPAALCVSGRRPTHALAGRPMIFGTDEEIIAHIVSFDASLAEVFEDAGLREIVLPAVRADYRLVDDFSGGPRPLLDCPVHGYTGDEDTQVTPEQMRRWAELTRGAFRLLTMPGGHLYLRTEEVVLLADLSDVLADIGSRATAS